MINLNKHLDFFQPDTVKAPIHVIGVGAMGSRVVEQLARLGVTNINIYDFDIVEDVNITNQLYTISDIGETKVNALTKHIKDINPDAIKNIYEKGYTGQPLSGYVFLCVDSIELRYKIAETNKLNPNIKAMFDTRMRLTDAQSYAANWLDDKQKNTFLDSMKFTDKEALAATPISACGTTLSVTPTVIICASYTVSNFINFVKDGIIKNIILFDSFSYDTNAF